jgi:ABC-type cobalamin/Fe3+-siderophores transport system ATPase subunit
MAIASEPVTHDIAVPSRDGQPREEVLSQLSGLVVVGANGSGKTRFGRRLEDLNRAFRFEPHRVGAQRLLQLPQQTNPTTLAQAEQNFRTRRWEGNDDITGFNADYQHILALIFAKESERNASFVASYREGERPEKVPYSIADKIITTWNTIFPQRRVEFIDGQVIANTNTSSYNGAQMSDGERVALYLMGQFFLAPASAFLIIDEPELHLHRAVRDALWNALEVERADCFFVYLTHDVDFAASRPAAKILWLKEFDGIRWKWDEIIPLEGLPESLLVEIIGSRRPVIFVEGEAGSLDTLLYSAAFPDHYLYPAGGCHQVIQLTKVLRGATQFHHLDAQGIIDRDRRTDEDVADLARKCIHVLDVAEVENLLLLPDVLRAVAAQLSHDSDDKLRRVQDLVFNRIAAQRDEQIGMHVAYRVEALLKRTFAASGRSASDLQKALDALLSTVHIQDTWQRVEELFVKAIDDRDYGAALRLFNEKSLVPQVANEVFGLRKIDSEDGLSNFVRRLLRSGVAGPIISAVKNAVPL